MLQPLPENSSCITNIRSVYNETYELTFPYNGVIMMKGNGNPSVETAEDVQIVKEYTLLPILLDMLARDTKELQHYRDKLIYNHLIFYLQEVEGLIDTELQRLKSRMRKQGITILRTTTNVPGIEVEYKVRGYIHQFSIMRSLVKAELMTMLMNLRGRGRQ